MQDNVVWMLGLLLICQATCTSNECLIKVCGGRELGREGPLLHRYGASKLFSKERGNLFC